ncbi:hypothetical protein QYF36_020035 [Acer negundo]|nr:hypothetical protein QYF36_020035 [Acer negundo]
MTNNKPGPTAPHPRRLRLRPFQVSHRDPRHRRRCPRPTVAAWIFLKMKKIKISFADDNQASTVAAFKIIDSVMTSQQQKSVPVQKDLFIETELKGEAVDD